MSELLNATLADLSADLIEWQGSIGRYVTNVIASVVRLAVH